MKRKKKPTPEEMRVIRERHEARMRELQYHIDKITVELAASQKPKPAGGAAAPAS